MRNSIILILFGLITSVVIGALYGGIMYGVFYWLSIKVISAKTLAIAMCAYFTIDTFEEFLKFMREREE